MGEDFDVNEAQTKAYADTCQTSTAGMAGKPRPYSLRDEAARRAENHYQEANKAQSAALFFSQHPEFEDFIRLVRQGAIQF